MVTGAAFTVQWPVLFNSILFEILRSQFLALKMSTQDFRILVLLNRAKKYSDDFFLQNSVNTINLKHEQKCELKRTNKNCHVSQKKLIRIKCILGDCSLAAIGFVNLVSRFCRFLDRFCSSFAFLT